MTEPAVPKPTGHIGVALSGGGYRAAAWGLGVLLYLEHAGLSPHITTISSVSGGSITNAVVGLRNAQPNPEPFEQLTRRLAHRLAGNQTWFSTMLASHTALWIAKVVMCGQHRFTIAAVLAGITVLFSVIGAQGCRDATFSKWFLWLYLDLVIIIVAAFAYGIGERWWQWAAALLAVAVAAQFRGIVVGWAIGATLLRTGGQRSRLKDLPTSVEHVLCACDLHGRHHAYFTRDAVYTLRLGLGQRPRLPLTTAVQASANLPGAFPPRILRSKPFAFDKPRKRQPFLALTDGGVYDNMADEWLLSYPERTASLTKRAAAHPLKGGLQPAVGRMTSHTPTFNVVANASGALNPKVTWTTLLPGLGELFSILRVKSILYDNGNTTRRRYLVSEFRHGSQHGILVSIDTNPWSVVAEARKPDYGPTVNAQAETAAAHLQTSNEFLAPDTTKRVSAKTVLYPLAPGRVAALLLHAYVLAMIQGHIWHALPLTPIPALEWFENLETGSTA